MECNPISSSSATAEERVAGNHVNLILPLVKLFVISGKDLGSLHKGVFQIEPSSPMAALFETNTAVNGWPPVFKQIR